MTEDVLRAAFVPFGEIIDINLPIDGASSKHRGAPRAPRRRRPANQHERPCPSRALSAQPARYLTGFAFVQFDERSDAADAIDNMDGAELYGRVLKVSAPPGAITGSCLYRVSSKYRILDATATRASMAL